MLVDDARTEPPAPMVEEHATAPFLIDYRLTHLPPDTRPLPEVAAYDQLLNRRRTGSQGTNQGEATCAVNDRARPSLTSK
ncbi:hypothetical protein [Streptomyces sp. NPDC059949]|uniref:hypothetical protein n=1 Tax=Streptomyces sp. NPDC059949 TaxID=3347013 RepID=UPI00365F504F